MRFKRLILEAFSTFKEKVEIDFTKLNESGMFLITGETGSGKTTIFDAICFALYGEVSTFSSAKSSDKIRSGYATNEKKTYVELYFELDNNEYYIKRIPAQKDILVNGRLCDIKHTVLFRDYKGNEITGVDEVNAKIVDLIGLESTLFRQVVMLPQNSFMMLLKSNTSSKEKIFRKIFNTSEILSFQEKIMTDLNKKESEIKDNKTELNTLIKQVNPSADLSSDYINYDDVIHDIKYSKDAYYKNIEIKNEEYKKKLEEKEKLDNTYNTYKEINQNILTFNEVKKALDDLVNDDKITNYRNILDKYNNASMLFDALNKKKELENNIQELKDDYKKTEVSIESKNKEKDEAKDKRISLENKKADIEALRENRLKLTQEMESSTKKANLKASFLLLDEQLNDLSIDNENDKAEKEKLLVEKQALEEEINKLKETLVDISILYKEKEAIYDESLALNEIKEKLNKKQELIALIEDCRLEFDRLKEENINISKLKAKTERQMTLNLASSLAKELKPDVPCPVCGSKEHPTPAFFDPNLKDIDLSKILADEAKNNAQTEQIILDKQKHAKERNDIEDFLSESELVKEYNLDISNIEDYVKENLNKKMNITDRIEEAINNNEAYNIKVSEEKEISNKILELTKSIDSFQQENEERLEALRDAKAQLKLYENAREVEVVSKEIDDITLKIDTYELEVKQTSDKERDVLTEIINLGNDLSRINNTISSYNGQIELLNKTITEYKALFKDEEEYNLCLNTNYDEIREYVNDYDSKKAILSNKLDELKPKIENKEIIDLTEIESNISILDNEVKELNKAIIEEEANLNSLNRLIGEIDSSYSRIKDKMESILMHKRLAYLANGQLSYKMNFEQYILSIYFEDVIDEANILLKDMSKNRFRLSRKKELKGKGYQGLELVLFDNKTCQMRGIETFSGGETFVASLSLALGLSNVIRRNSCKVSIDTLFIDEGFGSLSSNVLDDAYNILCDLADDNRVIGIISHVSELKNRIPSQIIVNKSDDGSTIEILD